MDICPIRPGHAQIIPREHFAYFEDLPDAIACRIIHLGQRLSRAMKTLYGVHLLLGLIAAIWVVFSQFQTSIPNGLLALILCLAGMMLWIVYCRVFVELLAVAFRVGHVIANSQN